METAKVKIKFIFLFRMNIHECALKMTWWMFILVNIAVKLYWTCLESISYTNRDNDDDDDDDDGNDDDDDNDDDQRFV